MIFIKFRLDLYKVYDTLNYRASGIQPHYDNCFIGHAHIHELKTSGSDKLYIIPSKSLFQICHSGF